MHRNPGRAVRGINPAPIQIKLPGSNINVGRQVLAAHVKGRIRIPAIIPLIPLVALPIAGYRAVTLPACGNVEQLALPDSS